MKVEIELCFICDEPTGNAEKSDDSLYAKDGTGPYCQGCWDAETEAAENLEDGT